jgi:hypothetical protein
MKKLLFLLFLLPSMFINAQVIDCTNFNEKRMNDVMFTDMHNHIGVNQILLTATVKKSKIYNFIKKNNEKLSVDELNMKINEKILTKYDSKHYMVTNDVGSIGFLDSIPCENVMTCQEISKRVINNWANSVDGVVFNNWSKYIEIDTFYNKKTKTVYLFFAFLR